MNELYLNKPWEEFKAELEQFIREGNSLKNMPVSTGENMIDIEQAIDAWDQQIRLWLESSFNLARNSYLISFHNAGANNFNIPGQQLSQDQQVVLMKGKIQVRTDALFMFERILSVSEAVIKHGTVNIEERAGLTIKQKRDFILQKMYELYDDLYYPLTEILKGNAVLMKRTSEAGEIAGLLEELGYLDVLAGIGAQVRVRITAHGAQFVEETWATGAENYDDIRYSFEEMSAKIDEVKDELKRSEMGHEILYNELQELKELYLTLNKKSWGQLLKGKLFDVALGKLVDNATIAFVYEAITDHKLKLL
jgi:hypothetical protein